MKLFPLLLLACGLLLPQLSAQRLMEDLDRGTVAVASEGGVFLSWRLLATEPAETSYHVYRDRQRVTETPISGATNWFDSEGNTASSYRIAAVIEGKEQTLSPPVTVWNGNYLEVPLDRPAGGTTPDGDYDYSPGDLSVGDLDGDGQYELVLKWNPSNAKDNSHSGYTGRVFLDAYELDGTRLWRIDLGPNIRAGEHYTQFMVYDLDNDGRAEVVCKTADGTTDGRGQVLGDSAADWRNGSGYILYGPEYLSAFDGQTGGFIDTVDYLPARGSVSSWGDSYGNRVDRFLACVAYLDGRNASVVMCRGYYTRSVLAAWDLVDGELHLRWIFDSNDAGNSSYAGQGNHNLSVADVDGDGRDEIIYGSCTIDDDGTGLYSTGLGHGDALHVSDMDPTRPGLEVWMPHETSASGSTYRDAATGEIIWEHDNGGDVGRGVAAHIDARYPGYQFWSYAQGGVYNTANEQISDRSSGTMMAFVVWWTDSLQREFLASAGGSGGNPILERWTGDGPARLWSIYNEGGSYDTRSINGTKANPCLSGDILGDWREEMIFHSSDNRKLRIFTTTALTNHRIPTLMHDAQYRLAMAWQNVSYNQPPHPSFYLGAGMETPPHPDIRPANRGSAAEYLESNGLLSLEAEEGDLGARWVTGASPAASRKAFLEIYPDFDHVGSTPAGETSPYLARYPFHLSTPGAYRFWFRMLSTTTEDDSFFWRIDGGPWNLENNRQNGWFSREVAELTELATGSHVLEIAGRENGTRLDKFVLQQEGHPDPSGTGPAESPRRDERAPTAPLWLTGSPSARSVHLSWLNNREADFASYTVYRSLAAHEPGTAIATHLTSESFHDADLLPGLTYYYSVKATDTSGNLSPASLTIPVAVVEERREENGILALEAENGGLGAHWLVVSDPIASQGSYLTIDPAHNAMSELPAEEGDAFLARYPFQVTSPGDYRFWFRILSDNGSDDSFFWRLDGGEWVLENNRSGQGEWFGTDGPDLDSLGAGHHLLEIAFRENGTLLDKFVLQMDHLPTPVGEGPPESPIANFPQLLITGLTPEGGLEFTGTALSPSLHYRLMRSTSLADFTEEVDQQNSNTGEATFIDPQPPETRAFYRLQAVE
ncbi:hypothetical protein [Roseibacillus ishigakijimensis]|uniref:Fibronectin type-III domain-containing protein n=1 Tax=Roseibacillus ishigakijimensis TaxID=454146 RepID=A0A934VN06_9BACT|nr:hypothetical protein [Roseibacillus ishigakijimensis]MBK1834812.1 hypothetical protein [Roseibacillus ishigakijimensis]